MLRWSWRPYWGRAGWQWPSCCCCMGLTHAPGGELRWAGRQGVAGEALLCYVCCVMLCITVCLLFDMMGRTPAPGGEPPWAGLQGVAGEARSSSNICYFSVHRQTSVCHLYHVVCHVMHHVVLLSRVLRRTSRPGGVLLWAALGCEAQQLMRGSSKHQFPCVCIARHLYASCYLVSVQVGGCFSCLMLTM